jgi:hypothetical protein
MPPIFAELNEPEYQMDFLKSAFKFKEKQLNIYFDQSLVVKIKPVFGLGNGKSYGKYYNDMYVEL